MNENKITILLAGILLIFLQSCIAKKKFVKPNLEDFNFSNSVNENNQFFEGILFWNFESTGFIFENALCFSPDGKTIPTPFAYSVIKIKKTNNLFDNKLSTDFSMALVKIKGNILNIKPKDFSGYALGSVIIDEILYYKFIDKKELQQIILQIKRDENCYPCLSPKPNPLSKNDGFTDR